MYQPMEYHWPEYLMEAARRKGRKGAPPGRPPIATGLEGPSG
jgi:hypothetical protein